MEDKFNEKLVILLSLFKDRPNHLAKFLIENSAFSKTFLNRLSKSNLELDESFTDINSMNDSFNSILDPVAKSLDDKLIELLSSEKYEEAARLRDQILKKSNKKRK